MAIHTRRDYVAYCRWYNDAFFKQQRHNVYLEYVREPDPDPTKKGKPFGVLVALRGDDGLFSLGWAVAKGPKKDNQGNVIRKAEVFDKAIGLCKAFRRACGQASNLGVMPHRLTDDPSLVDGFVSRAHSELCTKV